MPYLVVSACHGDPAVCLVAVGTQHPTVDLLHRDLSEDVEVGPVEDPSEDTIGPGVVRVDQRLIGYAVRHNPHPQEEEDEEDVLHLERERSFF